MNTLVVVVILKFFAVIALIFIVLTQRRIINMQRELLKSDASYIKALEASHSAQADLIHTLENINKNQEQQLAVQDRQLKLTKESQAK